MWRHRFVDDSSGCHLPGGIIDNDVNDCGDEVIKVFDVG
jgi:hypothetical protein